MRLIDADKLLKLLDDEMFKDDFRDTAKIVIKNEPTAYNVDRVVEQLEETKSTTRDLMSDARNYAIDRAIEIVKRGGKIGRT